MGGGAFEAKTINVSTNQNSVIALNYASYGVVVAASVTNSQGAILGVCSVQTDVGSNRTLISEYKPHNGAYTLNIVALKNNYKA